MKLFFILLLTILSIFIYFQNTGEISFNRIGSKKWSNYSIIQRLKNNGLVDSNEKHDISDSVENESNVPLKYYNEWKKYRKNNRWKGKDIKTCNTELPRIEEIGFNNNFWQTIPNTNETHYFLYNAFYDNRGTDKYVRVVVMQKEYSRENLWSVTQL